MVFPLFPAEKSLCATALLVRSAASNNNSERFIFFILFYKYVAINSIVLFCFALWLGKKNE
jgi:hypothetical protein